MTTNNDPFTWSGNISGDWSVASNWTYNASTGITATTVTPGSGNAITIPAAATSISNIYCQLVDVVKEQYLQCNMRDTVKRAPARPPWSDLDLGYAFKMAHADPSGVRICHGDTMQDSNLLTLDYGRVWRRGGYICKAETVGLTCINDSGHRFSQSRNSQRLF
jgi:hypothetical protein